MNTTNLYRIHPESKTLQSVREMNFSDHSFRERYDIQEWIEAMPSILGERLLIIAKEKTHFDGTLERPDLVAVDKQGNIVIIELKRDDSGSDVHWQAIRYASYWSRFSVHDVLEVFAEYLNRRRSTDLEEDIDEEYAKQALVEFIEQESLEAINKNQRLILVSHRFAREVVSAVDWLYENYGLDIRCVQLVPYFDEDKQTYYLQSNTVLPVPGIDEYLIQPSSGRVRSLKSTRGSRNNDEVTRFFESLRDALLSDASLTNNLKPTRFSRWAGSDYRFRYYHFWFGNGLWDNWKLSYRVWLYNDIEQNRALRKKAVVFLNVDADHLLENGVTEGQVADLQSELRKRFDSHGEFSFRAEDRKMLIEKANDYSNIDEALKQNLVKRISGLISETFELVQKVMPEEN